MRKNNKHKYQKYSDVRLFTFCGTADEVDVKPSKSLWSSSKFSVTAAAAVGTGDACVAGTINKVKIK